MISDCLSDDKGSIPLQTATYTLVAMNKQSEHDPEFDNIEFEWCDGTKCRVLFNQRKLGTVLVSFDLSKGIYTLDKRLFLAAAKEIGASPSLVKA